MKPHDPGPRPNGPECSYRDQPMEMQQPRVLDQHTQEMQRHATAPDGHCRTRPEF